MCSCLRATGSTQGLTLGAVEQYVMAQKAPACTEVAGVMRSHAALYGLRVWVGALSVYDVAWHAHGGFTSGLLTGAYISAPMALVCGVRGSEDETL